MQSARSSILVERHPQRLARSIAMLATAALLALSVWAPLADAEPKEVSTFFPADGVSSGEGGHFSTPRDLAVNDPSIDDGNGGAFDGWIYVVDDDNSRIQAFDSENEFQWAIGRNVSISLTTGDDSGAAGYAYEKCTEPTDCQGGTGTAAVGGFAGTLGGMFAHPQGIDIDQASGHLFVRDRDNRRVQELTADGEFVATWGADVDQPAGGSAFEVCTAAANCKAGATAGTAAAGAFAASSRASTGIATVPSGVPGSGGHVIVADPGNQRLMEFDPSATGAAVFVRAFGWDVVSTGPGDSTADERQSVKVAASAGAFTLTIAGQTTDPIAFNATSAQLQSALNALSSIGGAGGSVTVSGGPGDAAGSNPYEITFEGTLGGDDVDQLTSNAAGLSGGSAAVTTPLPGGAFEICAAPSTCKAGSPPSINDPQSPPGRLFADRPAHLAVDADGVVYASNRIRDPESPFGSPLRRVDRFDTTASEGADLALVPLDAFAAGVGFVTSIHALKVDPASDLLYQADNTAGGATTSDVSIKEYDLSTEPPTATAEGPHLAGDGITPNGIAVNASLGGGTGTLYVSSTSLDAHRVYVLDDDGVQDPDVTIDPVSGASAHEAVFSGSINPNGSPTSYRFQYSRDGVTWTDATAPQDVGGGTTEVAIGPTTATGLEANTLYRVRVLVTRPFGFPDVVSSEIVFATDAAPPEVTTLPPNQRGATTATLAGRLNPNGSATTYYFEYGKTDLYGARVPVPDGAAGAGGLTKQLSQPLSGLEPGTTYHYRLVAENAEGSVAGSDVAFTTRATPSPTPAGRAYELVSPADKIAGVGVGRYFPGDRAAGNVGFPSANGERFVAIGDWGSILLDGKFAYANDYAFADRVSDTLGWRSRSPFTRPNFGPAGARFARLSAASSDLSLLAWRSNKSHIKLFPELEDWSLNLEVPYLGDWQGRYEVVAPTDPQLQGNPGADLSSVAVSADGSRALLSTKAAQTGPLTGSGHDGFVGGLAGPGDPYRADTGEWEAGKATYLVDAAGGLEDAFPGEPADRVPVGVCDAGTEIPARIEVSPGQFRQGARPCPAPVEYQPGEFRDAALISPRGAVIHEAGVTTHRNVISADGSRVFFMSPDPKVDAGREMCDPAKAGADTACPAQLYVRQESDDGDVATRWVSRSTVADQAASLMSAARFQGASADGGRVLFKARAPLTPDDPNGLGVAPPGGVTAGAPDPNWDLYEFRFTGSAGDDPGAGTLTRISAGPTGDGDGVLGDEYGLQTVRFVSDDGSRVYFATPAPLPGVPAGPSGGTTAPAGTPSTTDTLNLYLYDANRPPAQRYQFVALLPRSSSGIASCASVGVDQGPVLSVNQTTGAVMAGGGNCVSGTADGSFITFLTDGQLVAGDDDSAADLYAYDAGLHELVRVTAPSGGVGGSYPCDYTVSDPGGELLSVDARCNGDTGLGFNTPFRQLGVVPDPVVAGDRIAFFQSRSRLVPKDTDDEYDVYQWRNGELSLLSVGTDTGAYFLGQSRDGRDVFFATRDQLSWQDGDAVLDVYDARVGGGIPEPPAAAPCGVLADSCQGPGAVPVPRSIGTDGAGGGNVSPPRRGRLVVGKLGHRVARAAARRGVISLSVRTSRAGQVIATARARLRTRRGLRVRRVARHRVRASGAGRVRLRLRLSKAARRQLRTRRKLRVRVLARMPGARGASRTVVLRLPSKRNRPRRATATAIEGVR